MKKRIKKSCSLPSDKESSCCKVESVISIDERGQMVLPKEIREAAKIIAGDKFAVIPMIKDGEVCCISLIKVEELSDIVKDKLGPLLKEII